MTILSKATTPPLPRNLLVARVALIYAAVLVVLAVTQLFSFDNFLFIVRDFVLPGGKPLAYFLAAFIAIAELLALPFLLHMRLSVAMRLLSMAMGWLVAGLWLFIPVWLVLTASNVTNIGLVGDAVASAPGWWTVLVGLVLVGLATWASWGMWPIGRRK